MRWLGVDLVLHMERVVPDLEQQHVNWRREVLIQA